MAGLTRALGLCGLDPVGSTFVCITDHPGTDTTGGRLVRLRSGRYAINLAGTLRACEQRWARRLHEQAWRYSELREQWRA